jgi:ribosomal protein RSM22 (predicted rRNA methylase)
VSDLATRWPQLRRAARRCWNAADSDQPLEPAERARAARAIEALSRRLTRERERVDERYLDERESLAAYLLFWWPVSYAQASSILRELGRSPGRVLDLGAGPLPMSWAALDAGASSVLALERVTGAALAQSLSTPTPELRAWDAGKPLPDGPYDTILAGHLLNELHRGERDPIARRASLVGAALRRLAPEGRLILIEPALRETSRDLLALRDRLLADGTAHVHAPCLMQAACPALARDGDWCHAERVFSPPPEHAQLAEAARIHKDELKMSYLVLGREPARSHPADRFRVVSGPLDEKGKLVRIGCGPRGRHRLVLRERDVTAHNAAFESLSRGDVVHIGHTDEKGDGLRLAADAAVERLAGAGSPPPE